MDRTTHIITIKSIDQIPTLDEIKSIPREMALKLIFKGKMNKQRERVGEYLEHALSGFQVLTHTVEPELNIVKLITDQEIEDHQDFFEQCAKDYRKLGEQLVFILIDKLDLNLNKDFPLDTFNELKRDDRQLGIVDEWKYFVHGFHCGFHHLTTGQCIEVPLAFGLEFGDLDPYFFMKFILSSPDYRTLPIPLFGEYADGLRIIKKMTALGKFEEIPSNVPGHTGVVVTDREKIEIKSDMDLEKIFGKHIEEIKKKAKFNLWEFLGIKR
ncbi:DUF6896 domain-containing protein [Sphingobacterium sp. Lzh-3]|uniref:DUF6896 domain-containing protein n=1 Tax=unclassified Sphingobacterium TaxID=2609468 RepID=UPI00295492D3|nr:hypothetical protein [Sphingobacterium sp. UGAL515B_05]WON92468.1 hypothetical protein OK025_14595 [Sphingobacterium sp. UGAL515B_05]